MRGAGRRGLRPSAAGRTGARRQSRCGHHASGSRPCWHPGAASTGHPRARTASPTRVGAPDGPAGDGRSARRPGHVPAASRWPPICLRRCRRRRRCGRRRHLADRRCRTPSALRPDVVEGNGDVVHKRLPVAGGDDAAGASGPRPAGACSARGHRVGRCAPAGRQTARAGRCARPRQRRAARRQGPCARAPRPAPQLGSLPERDRPCCRQLGTQALHLVERHGGPPTSPRRGERSLTREALACQRQTAGDTCRPGRREGVSPRSRVVRRPGPATHWPSREPARDA